MDLLGGEFGATLHRFIADALVDEAAAARSRQFWLEQQLAEGATLAGVLIDIAESQIACRATLTSGAVLRCRLSVVGDDFMLAVDDHDVEHFVALPAINHVAVESTRAPVGLSSRSASLSLALALAAVAEDRPLVAVHHLDGTSVRGELLRCGADHCTLRVREAAFKSVMVPLASLSHLTSLR